MRKRLIIASLMKKTHFTAFLASLKIILTPTRNHFNFYEVFCLNSEKDIVLECLEFFIICFHGYLVNNHE